MKSRRALATVLFTDIVGSTERAAQLGDRAWRELRARHHRLVREELGRWGGDEVTESGDGFLAVFGSPARAIACADAIRARVRELGLEIRSGLHMGQLERESDGTTGGIAVHVGARVAAAAEPGEILVTSAIRDAETGSGFGFEDHYYLGAKQVFTNFSWKLNVDTFNEFYHFEFLHPQSIATMAYSNITHYKQYGRNHSMGSATLAINELAALPEEQWEPRKFSSFVNYIFPNTVIFVVEDHFQTWRVYPIVPDRSVVYHSMFLPRAPGTEEEQNRRKVEGIYPSSRPVPGAPYDGNEDRGRPPRR